LALVSLFSAWSLALALLAFAVLGGERAQRRLGPAALLVLLGLGVATCSLAQTPAPWSQLRRIASHEPQQLYVPPPRARSFVATIADGPHRFVYRRGAPVALLMTNGHRIADAFGVRDVVPYTGGASMETAEQVDDAIRALRRAGGNTFVVPTNGYVDPGVGTILIRHGFEVVTPYGLTPGTPYSLTSPDAQTLEWDTGYIDTGELVKWVDTRHLHPRALGSR
jgi:hypothetical protein